MTTDTAKTLEMVRYIKAHGHEAWLCDEGCIGVIETYTIGGKPGARRVILEAPTMTSVREWLGY